MTSWWAGLPVHVYKQSSKRRNIHTSLMGTLSHACRIYPPVLSIHSVYFLDVTHLLRNIHKQCCQYFNIDVLSKFGESSRKSTLQFHHSCQTQQENTLRSLQRGFGLFRPRALPSTAALSIEVSMAGVTWHAGYIIEETALCLDFNVK